jgi:hypothetical protein
MDINTFYLVLNNPRFNKNNDVLVFHLKNVEGYDTFTFYFYFKKNPITKKFDLKEYFLNLSHDNYDIESTLEFKNGFLIFKYNGKYYNLYLNKLSLKTNELNSFIGDIIKYRFEIERYQKYKKTELMEVTNA